MNTIPPPSGWGQDKLTDYLDAFQCNQFATFAKKQKAMSDLIAIDAMFQKLLDGALNPKPYFPMHFMHRAHSAYRSGIGAIMGGQIFESQALLRLCLEHGAYGSFIGGDVDRAILWLTRGESDLKRKAMRKAFHNDRLREHLVAASPKFAEQFDRLYNQLIDFGAHPNEAGYAANWKIIEEEDQVRIETLYLRGDGIQMDASLKLAAQVALWVLHIMQLIYRERYELLGLREQMEEVRTRF